MATPEITKETLKYLADLARIKMEPGQEEKMIADLQNILGYVSELQSVDTSKVEPMNGGTMLRDIFREDGKPNGGPEGTNRAAGVEQFSDSKDGFLKIPPVFGGESK